MGCPSDDEIAALLEGQLAPAAHQRVLSHLDGCEACRSLVAHAGQAEQPAPLGPGSLLGRYVILGVLGAGAMGVVYAAHDPSLDRKIALKLLRSDAGEGREELSGRLLREARALARLAHPHVVAVHDVGTVEDEVFLAMELVEGGTLRQWLAETPRGWREILRLFIQAGEGLEAAHASGIVHRDFKPDNALVGRDGRVRVTDFGLARGTVEAAAAGGARPALSTLVTRTGTLAGTPAYMAPEQLAGQPATTLSDQFAFCVALHEALWGSRPGADRPLFPENTAKAGVPAALRKALARGLLARPEARWPGLSALLGELRRLEERSSPWRRLALAALPVALVAGFLVAWQRAQTERPCSSPFDAPSEGWDAAAQRRVREALSASLGSDGQRIFDELHRRLDQQASEIAGQRREACKALHLRKEISSTQFDQRELCLNRRRGELTSLIRLFIQADRAVLENAIPLAASLPDTGACRQFEALSRRLPLPADPAQRERIRALDERLTQAEALVRAQVQHDQAEQIASDVLAQAASLGWRQLTARALFVRGRVIYVLQSPQHSDQAISEAAATALEASDDETLADAWLARIDTAAQSGHLDRAEDSGRQARAAILRLGGDPRREASRLSGLCRAHERAGVDLAHAHALCQQALDLLRRERPDELYTLSLIEERLGNVLIREERYPEAERMYRDAIHKRQLLLPAGSHMLLNTRGNLAESLALQGHYPEAIEIFKELVQAHPWWHLYDGLALAYWRTKKTDLAVSSQRQSVAACYANDSQGLCAALASGRLGEFLLETAPDEARQHLERAISLRTKSVQIPPLEEARAHLLLARLERSADKIRAHHERAVELLTPVAHRGGNHQRLLEAARSPGRPLPPL